jgi:hypothetical protein
MSNRQRSPTFGLMLLVAAVLILHVWASLGMAERMQDLRGSAQGPALERMEAIYVSEVQLARPPVAVAQAPAAPPETRAAAKAAAASSAASAPEPDPKAPTTDTQGADTALAEAAVPAPAGGGADGVGGDGLPPELAAAPATQEESASAPASVAAPDALPRFVWPKATRVSYSVEGYFRGPVTGDASVEWVREGRRYQVHMETNAGIFGARFSSEGDILAEGLFPRLFERVIRKPLSKDERTVMRMDADEVTMPDGKIIPRPDDAQDAVSFLIQLSYSFMLDPSTLVPGRSFKMQLMTPKRVAEVAFDVVGEELLDTPLGRIQTLRVKPRSTQSNAGDLVADVWFAPELMYLPVRITLALKNGSSLDMQMKRAPQISPGDAAR